MGKVIKELNQKNIKIKYNSSVYSKPNKKNFKTNK